MFLEHQISILELFLKCYMILKTKISLVLVSSTKILVPW